MPPKRKREQRVDPTVVPAKNPDEVGGPSAMALFDTTADTRIRILRRDDKDMRYIHHGVLAPENANEETVGNMFGGGVYRAQLLVKDEAGREVIKNQREFRLPGPYKPPQGDLPTGTPIVASTGVSVQAARPAGVPQIGDILSAGVLQLFQSMSLMQQQSTQMMEAQSKSFTLLMERAVNHKETDWVALAAAASPLIAAWIGKSPEDRPDPLEMIEKVTNLVRANTGQQSNLKDMAEAMAAIADMRDAFGGGGPTGDPLMDSLPKLITLIGDGIEMQKRHAGGGASLPGQQPPVKALPAGSPVLTGWQKLLASQRGRLVDLARRGVNPELAAEMAVEVLPEQYRGLLVEALKDDEAATKIRQAIPEVEEFVDWFGTFFDALRIVVLGEEEGSGEEAERGHEQEPEVVTPEPAPKPKEPKATKRGR